MSKNFFITEENANEYAGKIAGFIKDTVAAAGKKGVVLGMSGGIDCSVCAALCVKAGVDVLLLMLPDGDGWQEGRGRQHSFKLISAFSLKFREIDITDICREIEAAAGASDRQSAINIRPRVRMTTLYAVAQGEDRLVMGTGNLAERTLGYFTKWGDGAYDLNPLAMLVKAEIRTLARVLGVPGEIIEKKPSADLYDGQTDEAEFGFSYDDIDRFILSGSSGDAAIDERISARIRSSMHKYRIPVFEG